MLITNIVIVIVFVQKLEIVALLIRLCLQHPNITLSRGEQLEIRRGNFPAGFYLVVWTKNLYLLHFVVEIEFIACSRLCKAHTVCIGDKIEDGGISEPGVIQRALMLTR